MKGLTLDSNSPPFPLTPHTRITAELPTEVQFLTLADGLDPDLLMSSLLQFHQFLNQLSGQLEQHQRQAEFDRFLDRERLNQQILFNAMNDLASPLQPDRSELRQEGSPLLVAAGAVAHHMGIPLRPPAASENLNQLKDPLEAIARSSKFRIRRVQLTNDWWIKDHGALLTYSQTGQPIALLPQSDHSYIAFGSDLARTPVDAGFAKTLSSEASMFYRPLPNPIKNLTDILSFAIRGHLKDAIVVVLLGFLGTLLGMIVPQATKILINDAIPSSDRGMVWQLGLALFAAACGKAAFGLAQGFFSLRVESSADATLQPAVLDRLLQLPTTFFRRYSMGDLLTRIMAVSQIRKELSGATQRTLLSAFFALLNLGLMLLYSVKLAVVGIGVTIVTVLLTGISSFLLLRQARQEETLSGKLNGLNVELINGVAKLRVAAAEDRAFGAWATVFSQRTKLLSRMQRIDDSVTVFTEALPVLSSVLILWFTMMLLQEAQQKGEDAITVGALLAFNSAFGTFLGGVTDLSNTFTNLLNIIPLWERTRPILKEQLETDLSKADPGRLTGRIQLEQVVFRYREDGPLILNEVSLSAAPGEFIALVGPSGSGKSTLLRILLGFEIPSAGTVYYDGQDLAGLDVHAVRRQCGVVLQNGRIGAGSLFENITGGALASLGQAWEAARMAGFAADIEQLPMGMHTVISEGGLNLSGGQRQRLLIARSIVLRPKMILLDEATSALDNRTQAIVAASLDQLNATRIVIAHRLSTIRNADRIYVMEAGRVVQVGRFEELVNQEGLFARLAARQLD
jgi:NHLM bacteriocin system ABC transporter ATP-binding protein